MKIQSVFTFVLAACAFTTGCAVESADAQDPTVQEATVGTDDARTTGLQATQVRSVQTGIENRLAEMANRPSPILKGVGDPTPDPAPVNQKTYGQ